MPQQRQLLRAPTRNLRRTDTRPIANVQRSIDVCVGCIAATAAGEDSLTPAVGLSDIPADMALLTSIPGVHQEHWHTRQPGFVLDEAAELGKSPAAHPSTLRLPERSPLRPNTRKVFKSDPTQGVCSSRNEPLTNPMVHITAKRRLPSGCPFEGTPDILGPFARDLGAVSSPLQALPTPGIPGTAGIDAGSTVRLSIAGGPEVDHAQIHADEIGDRQGAPLRQIDGNQQEPLAITAQDQIRLP